MVRTGEVGLVEAYDGFGAAGSPNGDFLLPAILFDLILNNRERAGLVLHRLDESHESRMLSRLPDSFSAVLNVRCRSSSQTWAAHPGPIFSCVNGPRGFQTSDPPVGHLCSSQSEDSCSMGMWSDVRVANRQVTYGIVLYLAEKRCVPY